jgi:putative ABC transport system permease protein
MANSFPEERLRDIWADIRYAFRVIRKSPEFSVIAIITLALGIAANTAIFSVVNAVLLRPLPYPHSDRLVQLERQFRDGRDSSVSIPKFMTWKDNTAFSAVAAFDQESVGMNLGFGGRPEPVKVLHVSREFFDVFDARTLLGRTFSPQEDSPGGARVAVISEAFWRRRFSSDPSVLGRSIALNAQPYTVIGVLSGSYKADPEADVWIPLQPDPNSTNQGAYLAAVARMKDGVTLGRANAEAVALGKAFRRANPQRMDKSESVAVVPLREAKTGNVRLALLVLMGSVGFVLLIACANVANLLLSRAAARQKELAIRSAIGANRWRVVRQLLTESVVLAGLGGVVGLALGILAVRGLLVASPVDIPRIADLSESSVFAALDWRMLFFTVAISIATGVLFGLFPAMHVIRTDISSTLKESSSRGSTGARHNRSRSALMLAELALTLVLLTGASLLIRTFIHLRNVDPGIDSHNVVTFQTSLAGGRYNTTAAVERLTREVVQRLEAVPGVHSAGMAVALPVTNEIDLPFNIPGKPPKPGEQYNGDEQWREVTPHYFETFRIPLRRGRLFDDRDVQSSMHVVIINEAMAKRYWPGEDALGKDIIIGKGLGPQFEEPARQIIGIVGNVKETGLNDSGQPGVMYVPAAQVTDAMTSFGVDVLPFYWAVRIVGNPQSVIPAIQREFTAVDASVPLTNVRMMDSLISESIARQNFNMQLLTIFAALALVIAAVGIYGLMSYSVQQRIHEMGIRLALGAQRTDIFKLVLRQAAILALGGVVLGIIAALGLTRVMSAFLFGIRATDPVTFISVAVLLSAVVLFASYIPAMRATRVDPAIALRVE